VPGDRHKQFAVEEHRHFNRGSGGGKHREKTVNAESVYMVAH
jgi:hypothetical protein